MRITTLFFLRIPSSFPSIPVYPPRPFNVLCSCASSDRYVRYGVAPSLCTPILPKSLRFPSSKPSLRSSTPFSPLSPSTLSLHLVLLLPRCLPEIPNNGTIMRLDRTSNQGSNFFYAPPIYGTPLASSLS